MAKQVDNGQWIVVGKPAHNRRNKAKAGAMLLHLLDCCESLHSTWQRFRRRRLDEQHVSTRHHLHSMYCAALAIPRAVKWGSKTNLKLEIVDECIDLKKAQRTSIEIYAKKFWTGLERGKCKRSCSKFEAKQNVNTAGLWSQAKGLFQKALLWKAFILSLAVTKRHCWYPHRDPYTVSGLKFTTPKRTCREIISKFPHKIFTIQIPTLRWQQFKRIHSKLNQFSCNKGP